MSQPSTSTPRLTEYMVLKSYEIACSETYVHNGLICNMLFARKPHRLWSKTAHTATRGASGHTHSRLSWHVSGDLLDLQERKRRQGLTLGLQVGISRTSWNRPASQTRDLQDLLDSSLGEDKVTLLSPIPPAASAICKIILQAFEREGGRSLAY